MSSHPLREITGKELLLLISSLPVRIHPHATFRLSMRQQDRYTSTSLVNLVTKNVARRVYLQQNNRYRAYYRQRKAFDVVILSVTETEVVVVTFMRVDNLPRKQQ